MTNPKRVSEILIGGGRLCINPTDLTSSYPFGGLDFGVVKNISVKSIRASHKITAEEFGVEVSDIVDGGENWIIGAVIRNYDKVGLAKIFPNTSVANNSLIITHNEDDTKRAGHLISSRSVKLLYAPDALSRDPFVLFYKALPLLEETAEFNFSADTEMGLAIFFQAIRDSNDKIVQMGKKENITL